LSKATIKQVAAEAGVSTATVSRVLNESGFVNAEIKERVFDVISRLNYQPNAIAKSLKQDKTYMIGVLVPDISNPYFMGISRGIEDTVGEEGFQLTFCSSDENSAKENRLLQMLYKKRVDAIVLATAGGNASLVTRMVQGGMPIVLIDRLLEQNETNSLFDSVTEDNTLGAYKLTRQLLDNGHTLIGVVNGPNRVSTGLERYDGVIKALREKGLTQTPLVYNGDFSTEGGIRAVRQFLQADPKPTAIISLNNQMTFGVLLELIRSGLRIPGDITVASFGDVDQRPYDMGKRTGELLLKRIRKENEESAPIVETFQNDVKQIR
jgi:LacI family transcriptional regulator